MCERTLDFVAEFNDFSAHLQFSDRSQWQFRNNECVCALLSFSSVKNTQERREEENS